MGVWIKKLGKQWYANNFSNYRQPSNLSYMCLTYHKFKICYNGKKYQSKSKHCDYKDRGQLMQKQKKKVKQIHLSFEYRGKLSMKK